MREKEKETEAVLGLSHPFVSSDEGAAIGAEMLNVLASIDAEGDAAAEPEAAEEADAGNEPAEGASLILNTGGDEGLTCGAVAENRAL